ncbi:hypothetical protein DL769_007268 [Monosporascus sp. CRB-8-3]|nr:hypothetical protein DL769_007268 [Monosporascus sp. CRB-8-3]
MDYDFSRRWAHLKAYIVRLSGEAVALNKLRAATRHRLESCDPETLTMSYLQYQILGDLYRDITGNEMQSQPPRWAREPHEPKIEKEILLSLVADQNVGLDILERQIETNAQEYVMGTREAVVAPVTSPSAVYHARSSGTGYRATSAPPSVFVPPQSPAPQRGLADSRWATQPAEMNPRARQPQTPSFETRDTASVNPLLPGQALSGPQPPKRKLSQLSQAQAVPVVIKQSMQQKVQRELQAKAKLLTGKVTEPRAVGGGPWEILLPPSVHPLGSIKPYQRVVEDILGVDIVIKNDRLEIGQSSFQLAGRPALVRAAVMNRRRISAYTDLAAYVKYSRDTGVAPDIVDFLLARQVDVINKLRNEQAELSATKQAILSSNVAAPVAPHGEYVKYSADHSKSREGQASNTGNKNAARGGKAPDSDKPSSKDAKGGKAPDSDKPSSQAGVQGPPPPTAIPLPEPSVNEPRGDYKKPRWRRRTRNRTSSGASSTDPRRNLGHMVAPPNGSFAYEKYSRVRHTDVLTTRPKGTGGKGAGQGAGNETGGDGAGQGADNETCDDGAGQGAGNKAAKVESEDSVEDGEEWGPGSEEGAASKGKGSSVRSNSKEVPPRAKSQK